MRERGWLVADLFVVVLFVVIGRSNHHHGLSLGGIVSTAWPFAIGLVVAWLALALAHRPLAPVRSGVVVTVVTVVVGMILRVLAAQGTAFAFILVALAFLGATMVGARWVVALARRRRG